MTHPAALHILTPGTPAYALAKMAAVGGVIALRMWMVKRERERRERDG